MTGASSMFEVVGDAIPSNWRVRIDEEGNVDVGPTAWAGAFWDDYFQAESANRPVLERELTVIREQENDSHTGE